MHNFLERLDKTLDSFTVFRAPFAIQFNGNEINFELVDTKTISPPADDDKCDVSVMYIELWGKSDEIKNDTIHVEVSMKHSLKHFLLFADTMTSIFIDGSSKNRLLQAIKTTLSLPDKINEMTLKKMRCCEVPFHIDDEPTLYVSKITYTTAPRSESSEITNDDLGSDILQNLYLDRNGNLEMFRFYTHITRSIDVAAQGILIKILLQDKRNSSHIEELNVLYQYARNDENITLKNLIPILKGEKNERYLIRGMGKLVDFFHEDINFQVTELEHIQNQTKTTSLIEQSGYTPIFIPFRI